MERGGTKLRDCDACHSSYPHREKLGVPLISVEISVDQTLCRGLENMALYGMLHKRRSQPRMATCAPVSLQDTQKLKKMNKQLTSTLGMRRRGQNEAKDSISPQ